jgi:hypothetical protein
VSLADDVPGDCDALAGADVFGLDDGDELSLGEAEVVETVAWAAEVPQDELGLAWTVFLASPAAVGSSLALCDADGVIVGVASGVTLGVGVTVGLGLTLALGEEPAEELAGLVVLAPLWLPLDDVAGEADVSFVLGELLSLTAADRCVDCDAHGLGVLAAATPAGLPDGALLTGEATGVVPLLSVLPGPLDGVLLSAEPMAFPTCTMYWRAGGTTDRTTPTANTAAPIAKAGRSIASRQSLRRSGALRCGALRCDCGGRPWDCGGRPCDCGARPWDAGRA